MNNAQTGDVGDDTSNGGETGDAGEDLTDPDGGACDNECSTAGAGRCDGDERHECVEDAAGCLSWEAVETCSGEFFCSAGRCVSQCQDACSTVGARRCEGGGSGSVAECQVDPNGCLGWTSVQDCVGVETCSNGECAEECTDECAAVNDRTCDGDGYKVCGNFDADPCLDWGDVVPCNDDATCSNGYCAVQCTDECSTPGVDECVAGVDARRTCGDFDADSCLEWSTPVSCGADEACSTGNAHILWIQTLTYTSQVCLRYATNASGSWVDTEVLDPFQSSTTAFAIDATDKLHASHFTSGSSPFQYGTYDPGTGMWSWEDGPMNRWDQFGLDPAGTPFVTDGVLDGIELHRRAGSGNWTLESTPVYGWGTPIRAMFDDASNLHLIYRAGGGHANYQTRHAWK